MTLVKKLEDMGKVVVHGSYISNSYNMEALDNLDEFMKVAGSSDVKRVYHNDLSDMQVSAQEKARMLKELPFLKDEDFKPSESMYTLDREEFICSDGTITVRYVGQGE